MRNIISVEYCPDKKNELEYLSGCVGEVIEEDFLAAKEVAEKKEIYALVRTRFPLNGSSSRIDRRTIDNEDSFNKEATYISIKSLYKTDKVPVSKYQRHKYNKDLGQEQFTNLFEAAHYIYVRNIYEICSIAKQLRDYLLPHGWFWKKEWDVQRSDSIDVCSQFVFVEARFYGIDSVLGVYNKNKLSGVVIELIVHKMRKTSLRKSYFSSLDSVYSNILVAANTKEYVEYLDGVNIPRTRLTNWNTKINTLLSKTVTPKEWLTIRRKEMLELKDEKK